MSVAIHRTPDYSTKVYRAFQLSLKVSLMERLPAEGDPQWTMEEVVAQDVAFIAYAGQWLCKCLSIIGQPTDSFVILWWSPQPPPTSHDYSLVVFLASIWPPPP